MAENNITATTIRLLNYLRLPITKQSIRQALTDHESPDSLLALSEALTKWKIKNAAYNIDIESFGELPWPFLVRLKEFGGQFGFVTDVTADELVLVKEYDPQQRIKLSDFRQRYTGVVLVIEPEANAGESSYFTKRAQELIQQTRLPLLLSSVLVILASILALSNYTLWWSQLTIVLLGALKLSGVAVSSLLLNQSFGQSSLKIEKWCRFSKTDCASVLTSQGAKLFGGLLSWAELGFFYFAGTGLILLLPQIGGIWLILRVLNGLCICFSVYSVYYQYKIAKHWCLLCCILLVLFYSELFLMTFSRQIGHSNILELSSWPLLGVMLVPISGWLFLKPYFSAAALVPTLHQRLQRFERNKQLFSQLLAQQPTYAVPEATTAILLGQPQSTQVLTIISNPSCIPCSRMHLALDNLLAVRSDIQVRLLFAVDEQQDKIAVRVASTLLALQQTTPAIIPQALHDWYRVMDYSVWSQLYNAEPTAATQVQLAQQQQWCADQLIEFTPTILVNGYLLPIAYDLEMLKYLL